MRRRWRARSRAVKKTTTTTTSKGAVVPPLFPPRKPDRVTYLYEFRSSGPPPASRCPPCPCDFPCDLSLVSPGPRPKWSRRREIGGGGGEEEGPTHSSVDRGLRPSSVARTSPSTGPSSRVPARHCDGETKRHSLSLTSLVRGGRAGKQARLPSSHNGSILGLSMVLDAV